MSLLNKARVSASRLDDAQTPDARSIFIPSILNRQSLNQPVTNNPRLQPPTHSSFARPRPKSKKMASNGSASTPAAPAGPHAPLSRTALAATSIPQRERPPPTTDLSAGTSLQLGDFAASPALSISQTRYLVDTIMQARRNAGKRFAETE